MQNILNKILFFKFKYWMIPQSWKESEQSRPFSNSVDYHLTLSETFYFSIKSNMQFVND